MLNAPILNTSSDGFQVMKLSNSVIVFFLDFLDCLDIKSEVHDIAILHHIVLTLDTHLAGLTNSGF